MITREAAVCQVHLKRALNSLKHLKIAITLGASRNTSSSHDPPTRTARSLQLTGSALALVVGSVGFAIALSTAVEGTDPEYGPMSVGLLLAGHGLVSLLAYSTSAMRSPSCTT